MIYDKYPKYDIDVEKGTVYSLTYNRYVGRKCGIKTNPYLGLTINNKTKLIHRMIWECVNGEIPKGYEIDNIDRNRNNNFPDNWRLVTKKENNQNKDIKGEKNGFSKLKEREVREILELVLTHKMTKQEIADKYHLSFATIKAIRSGRSWLSFTRDIFEKHGIYK